jgi:hypothetical protein
VTDFADADFESVLHILTAPLIVRRTAPYIGWGDFDFPGLLREAETMSGGEGLLVRIAHDLWEAEKTVGLWELPRRLDAHNFGRVVEALAIAHGRGYRSVPWEAAA